jgi:ATP-dependent Lhr-like helicase
VAEGPAPDPHELARKIESKATEKFDSWLSEELLCDQFISAQIDCTGALEAAHRIIQTVVTAHERWEDISAV